jgi:tRNA pseudouridine38-40 synthase
VNYKLTLQYDGTDFHGWQIQGGLRTVQGELTRALSVIDGKEVTVHGSGRTDAGVHAEGQVASVVLEREITANKLRAAINGNVDKDLRVMNARIVDDTFHARYSARGKTYRYRVVSGPVISPFLRRYAYHDARRLDFVRMERAADLFLGKHDWTAFSAAQSDIEDRVRTISKLQLSQTEDTAAGGQVMEMEVSADGFLRYMVRSIAGTLFAVGRGELTSNEVSHAIEHGVRPKHAVTAPACGLTLMRVLYETTD